jgi:hypothetical protein
VLASHVALLPPQPPFDRHDRPHSEQRIEEMGQPDAVGFRDQAEELAVAVEALRSAGLGDLELRLWSRLSHDRYGPMRWSGRIIA